MPSGQDRRRVLLVFGTRPEAIKMMPILRELRGRPGVAVTACSTGQHREMLDQVLDGFAERCETDLGLMTAGQTLPELTARIMLGVSGLLAQDRPDAIMVHGDTTTAMAAAMAGFYARVPIFHVEAGLRSHDSGRPWPEEFNRVAVDAIATLMFAPTEAAAANLRGEYNRMGSILVTGNTGIDALLATARRITADPVLQAGLAAGLPPLDPGRRLIVVTGHRRESLGAGLAGICEGVAAVAARGDVQVIYPMHLNPQVRDAVRARLEGLDHIHLIAPVDYQRMVLLMMRATLLLTDSGGLQEEGPALGKPVLVLRDVTERPEALAAGAARLVGTDPRRILAEVARLLDDPRALARMARPVFPYGDGHASQRIADAIEAWSPA
jgi:UDP-N-acetylglucosamine 2-epimerase